MQTFILFSGRAARLSVRSAFQFGRVCPPSPPVRTLSLRVFMTYVLPDRPRSVLCSLVERVSPGQTRSEQEPLHLFENVPFPAQTERVRKALTACVSLIWDFAPGSASQGELQILGKLLGTFQPSLQ